VLGRTAATSAASIGEPVDIALLMVPSPGAAMLKSELFEAAVDAGAGDGSSAPAFIEKRASRWTGA
jgi:hypothetical protein